MYSEFIDGTGCRQNDHNYQIFKGVETLYNTVESMTKEQAYSLALPLLDNNLNETERLLVEYLGRLIEDRDDELEELERWYRETPVKSWDDIDDLPATDDELEEFCQILDTRESIEKSIRRSRSERSLLEQVRRDITSGRYR